MKRKINSDGLQFYQYQQNQQSPLTQITKYKQTTTYDVGNSSPALGQAHKCGWDKPFKGIPTS